MKLSFFSDDDGDDGEVSDDEDDFGVMTVQSWNLFDGRVSLTDSAVSGTSLTLSLILFRPVFKFSTIFVSGTSLTLILFPCFVNEFNWGFNDDADIRQLNLGSLFYCCTNFTFCSCTSITVCIELKCSKFRGKVRYNVEHTQSVDSRNIRNLFRSSSEFNFSIMCSSVYPGTRAGI